MFNSIRNTMTVIFVTLAVVPIIIFSLILAQLGVRTLEDEAINTQADVARLAHSEISSLVTERINQLQLVTKVRSLTSLGEAEQRQIMSSLLTFDDAYKELVLLDTEGQEVLRLARDTAFVVSELTSRADQAEFLEPVATHETYSSPVQFDEVTSEPLIILAIPIINLRSNQVEGVLAAEFRFRIVWELINVDFGGTENEVYVTDASGLVVAHPVSSVVLRGARVDLPSADGRTVGLSGNDVILARTTLQIGGQEFFVVAERSASDALNLANTGLQVVIVVTIATLIVATITVILVVRRIVTPIEQLSVVASKIGKGNQEARATVKGRDELSELAKSFNTMAETVQQREQALNDLNQSLELRVEERTFELKNSRDEALAAQRIANENSRLKSEFLSMMSHELRTPMNAIEGFTSIMLKHMGGAEYNDKTERYINKVQSNSQRLLGLINDFLDLSRIESGRLELAHSPMSPYDMAQKWQDNLSVLAEDKGLDFEVSVDPNLPETLYGDEESLSKIAINLLGNAIKFTQAGSVSLSLEKRDNQMVLEVTDTGMGIPPHAREFVFEEFRQVDQSSKREHGGTGLGLTIVQKLAREMGGTITLQSEVGVGSTFTVLLPIQTEKQYA